MKPLPPVITDVDLPGLQKIKRGKVREIFDAGEHLLFVATDRISAFDCILPNGIPAKGHVLNQLSAWWFRKLAPIAPNHFVTDDVGEYPSFLKPHEPLLRGRSMLVRKLAIIPVECVARGYLAGSGWKEYQQTRSVCGISLRDGYRLADRLDEPIFTPAHKADTGHDENIPFEAVVKVVGTELATQLRDLTLRLYREAAAHAESRGIILADTKFEFGLENGRPVLADEVLTPDSSRYWPADSYQPGRSPPSFDKQFVRDYLESIGWNKQPPAPRLPEDVVKRTAEKYIEAFERLTGNRLIV